jgi:hypothetical protein
MLSVSLQGDVCGPIVFDETNSGVEICTFPVRCERADGKSVVVSVGVFDEVLLDEVCATIRRRDTVYAEGMPTTGLRNHQGNQESVLQVRPSVLRVVGVEES